MVRQESFRIITATVKAIRSRINAVLGAKVGVPGRLKSRIDPLMLPLDPDEQVGFKLYHQFQGCTDNAKFLSCHVSVLVHGHCPHPPHTHSEEEILLLLAGEADLILPRMASSEGKQEFRLTPGQFVYYPAYFPHTLRTVSAHPANYLMFKWRAPCRNRAQLDFGRFDIAKFYFTDENSTGFKSRLLFEGPTGCLGKLHAHATTLAPGAGYKPHVDRHDGAIVILQGEVETLGQRVRPHGIIYFAAGEPHGMHNPGAQPARYVVFEFHRRVPLLRKITDPQRWKGKLKAAWRR